MRLVVIVVVASCTTAPPANRPTLTPENWASKVTPLEVIVLDDYRTHPSCDGVAPRSLEVSLDGAPKATVTVPCRTTVRAPPPQFAAPAFDVTPGKHVIRVREVASGAEATADVAFPLVDPPFGGADDDVAHQLATKLPVWANDDELEIQGLRALMNL